MDAQLIQRLLRAVDETGKPKTLARIAATAGMDPARVRRGLETLEREHPNWLHSEHDRSAGVDERIWWVLEAGGTELERLDESDPGYERARHA